MPQSASSGTHHKIVIFGGGSAGISVASRLRHAGETDVALIDPAETHYYQPLWTLVGGGCSTVEQSARKQADVMPKGIQWIRQSAAAIDPDIKTVSLGNGNMLGYDFLIVCPGIQLDWHKVPGLSDTLGRDGVSSNYLPEPAPRDLGVHPRHEARHRRLRHAERTDQVRWRPAEDCLSRRGLLETAGRAQRHPRRPGPAHPRHVRRAGVRQGARTGRQGLRPRGAPELGGRRGRPGQPRGRREGPRSR